MFTIYSKKLSIDNMMLTFKNYLFFTLSFVLLHLGQSWKYCDNWDTDRDQFGVSEFEVKPKSLHAVHFKLKGTPEVGVGNGDGDLVPKLELKLFESESKKEIYSATKDLCDFTDCPIEKNQKAAIKVRIDDLDEKLQRNLYYTGEMTVIKKCGTKITCVYDKFCILGKHDKDGSYNFPTDVEIVGNVVIDGKVVTKKDKNALLKVLKEDPLTWPKSASEEDIIELILDKLLIDGKPPTKKERNAWQKALENGTFKKTVEKSGKVTKTDVKVKLDEPKPISVDGGILF